MADDQSITELIGKTFNNFVVDSFSRFGRRKTVFFNCKCCCGKVMELQREDFVSGHRKSCGCKRWKWGHEQTDSLTYRSWSKMLSRCRDSNNDAFHDYGGRGISVCGRWESFLAFREDMGERPSEQHSIDRINVNGNYELSNCRWATKHQQVRNTRRNNIITYNGETMCMTDWANRLGISPNTLRFRIDVYGWSVERAFTEKVHRLPRKE